MLKRNNSVILAITVYTTPIKRNNSVILAIAVYTSTLNGECFSLDFNDRAVVEVA